MSLERTYSITGRAGPLGRKALALVGALVLVLGAFVVAGREARAQQLPQEEARQPGTVAEAVVNQHTVLIDGEVVEPVSGTLPVEESPPNEPSPAAAPLPTVRYDFVADPEPTPPVPEPDPITDTGLVPAPLESGVELMPAPEPDSLLPVEPPVDLVSEPAVFEEDVPISASVTPAVSDLEEEEYSSPPGPETPVSSEDVSEGVANGPLFRLTVEDGGLTDTALVSSGGEAGLPSERTQDPGSPYGGAEGPARSVPQPSSPFALPPVGGGAFSLTGSDVGSGGVHLLLLCVLVSGLILSRRDGGFSWGFWEPPKPSSALLLPLERPG